MDVKYEKKKRNGCIIRTALAAPSAVVIAGWVQFICMLLNMQRTLQFSQHKTKNVKRFEKKAPNRVSKHRTVRWVNTWTSIACDGEARRANAHLHAIGVDVDGDRGVGAWRQQNQSAIRISIEKQRQQAIDSGFFALFRHAGSGLIKSTSKAPKFA